jgi:hypothetical protein
LTGNGVAFVLRVQGTEHGDWWSTRGWWIFAGTAAVSLLSKYVIRVRGDHVFNPSNFGLVLCFLILGSGRVEPLDFWWGPMSAWMVVALALIVGGGLAILTRLHLLRIAAAFWVTFAAALALLTATGHEMTARWHLGPVTGLRFWWILVTSPEILVFLFFMITDPKTIPRGQRARVLYGVAIGLLAVLLIAPAPTEYWSKVAVLGALALVCLVRGLWLLLSPAVEFRRSRLAAAGVATLALYGGALYVAGMPARSSAATGGFRYSGPLPAITILPSKGVDAKLGERAARRIVRDLMGELSTSQRLRVTRVSVWLEPGAGQGGSAPVVKISPGGETVELTAGKAGHYRISRRRERP